MSDIFQKAQDSAEGGVVLSFPIRQRSCGDEIVKRLEVYALFELATEISRFRQAMQGDAISGIDFLVAVHTLDSTLKKFRSEQPVFGLALDNAWTTMQEISSVLDEFYEDSTRKKIKDGMLDATYNSWKSYGIKSKLSEFEHVLSAVCRKSETYFIERKLGFDTSLLLHHAEENIHESIRSFVSKDALDEIRSAGRCFAVENFTASGFHILRALEVVMGDYYKK